VSTDRAPGYPRVLDALLPACLPRDGAVCDGCHRADHGRLKSRLQRGLKRLRSARVISAGHAFVQNLHRGHYDIATHIEPSRQLPAALAELALAI
jgi:IS6 family transposase